MASSKIIHDSSSIRLKSSLVLVVAAVNLEFFLKWGFPVSEWESVLVDEVVVDREVPESDSCGVTGGMKAESLVVGEGRAPHFPAVTNWSTEGGRIERSLKKLKL